MKQFEYLVISTSVLPDVFNKVALAKCCLEDGTYSSVSEAVKKIGVSRSAYYKYKDNIFTADYYGKDKIVNLSCVLADRAGVFSALTAKLYRLDFNILSVNQSLPVNGTASVSLSVLKNNVNLDINESVRAITEIDGVISVKVV